MIDRFQRVVVATAVLCLVLVVAPPASAQVPDEFTNLKVLPKDMGKREVMDVMRNFSVALGVRCKFCHVGESETSLEGYDFASDDPKHKLVARGMMQMVGEINGKLLPAAGLGSPMRVTCRTCHRGLAEPETLDSILWSVADEQGVAAVAKRYAELRAKYYGSGSYDFGPATLSSVAERMAQDKGDLDGAIAVAELNLEHYPDVPENHLMLGQLHARKGNRDAAIASIERALELDPDNGWAKQMLQRVRAAE